MPLYTVCAFTKVHKKNWRFKGSKDKKGGRIRSKKSTGPGAGTSCDHIVSHQHRLTPQSLGKLIHATFWGSVMYEDDNSDLLYNHLVHVISSEEIL